MFRVGRLKRFSFCSTGNRWFSGGPVSAGSLENLKGYIMGTTVECPSSTCTLVISPYVATADDYAAVSAIFGAILAAACVIWGVKKIYNLIANRPEA